MSGDLIVRVFFFGLIAFDAGNGDYGRAYLVDPTHLEGEKHFPRIYWCASNSCGKLEVRDLLGNEINFQWIAKSNRLTLDYDPPYHHNGDVDPEGLPDSPEEAADFRWVSDLPESAKTVSLRSCLEERRKTPCKIVSSVVSLDHGRLSTCQLARFRSDCNYCEKAPTALLTFATGGQPRAAANVVLLEMRHPLAKADGVGISAREFGVKYGFPVTIVKTLHLEDCNEGDKCAYVFVSNQPAHDDEDHADDVCNKADHFAYFSTLFTALGGVQPFVPVAEASYSYMQPWCDQLLQSLFPVRTAVSEHCRQALGEGRTCKDFLKPAALGDRPICPLIRD